MSGLVIIGALTFKCDKDKKEKREKKEKKSQTHNVNEIFSVQ